MYGGRDFMQNDFYAWQWIVCLMVFKSDGFIKILFRTIDGIPVLSLIVLICVDLWNG